MPKKTHKQKFDEYFYNNTEPFYNRMNTSDECHVALTQYFKSNMRQKYLDGGCRQLKNGDFDLVSYYKERFGRQAYCYNVFGQRRYCWTFETHNGRFRSAIIGCNGKGISLETDRSATDEEALEIWRLFCQKVYGTTFEDVNVDRFFEDNEDDDDA